MPCLQHKGMGMFLCYGAHAGVWDTLRHSVAVGLNSDTPVKEDINFSHNKGLMELPHAACGRVEGCGLGWGLRWGVRTEC